MFDLFHAVSALLLTKMARRTCSEVIVANHRNEEVRTVELFFHKEQHGFGNLERDP